LTGISTEIKNLTLAAIQKFQESFNFISKSFDSAIKHLFINERTIAQLNTLHI